ncbi:MAG: efflux RND transporter periplasmic adaptor subunit, partial [Gemmobacter sp.]
RLVGSGVTQADLETARAEYEQAEAALQSAEAALDLAEIELGWTTVTSPIDGISGLAQVSVGDLVTASQSDIMATVTRLDPIEVDMFEPSARMLQIRDEIESGRIRAAEQLNITLTLENGSTYASQGVLVASGSEVSTTTGTVEYRFRADNPDGRILPGMFLRGELEIGRIEGILVPQMITSRDRAGALTVWVAEDGKAVRRRITADGSHQNAWVVVDGLQDGEQMIVDGTTNLREGAEVAPVPVRIDENGVVRDLEAAPAQSE